MLQTLHDRFSGLIAKIVLGILVIVFGGFFGIQSYMNPRTETFVARVNGHEITQDEFRERYNAFRSQMQRMYGAQFDALGFDTPERKREMLDQLVNEQLILDANDKLGAMVPATQIRDEIMSNAAFQVDGKFDAERYRLLLAAQQMSSATLEDRIRRDLAQRQLPAQLAQTAIVTDADVNSYLRLRDQTRDIRYLKLEKPVAHDLKIEDADLDAYYKAHSSEFMTPEKISLDYVELDAAKMQTDIKADDAVLKQRYDDQKARYIAPEQRLASHILIKVDKNADAAAQKTALEKAQGIAKDAKSGKDFAALAKAESQDLGSKAQGGDLGWLDKGVTDPAFESALFAMNKGDVSEPVKSEEGYHVIQLRDVRAEKVRSFDEVKAELTKQYLESERERIYSDVAGKLTDAVQETSSLDAAAKKLNLNVQKTALFARNSGEGIAANPMVLKAAFSNSILNEGNSSDSIELGPNHIVVVHLDQHEKSIPRAFDQVREQIRAKLVDQQLTKQAAEQAEALYARLQKGETLDQIATGLKLKVEEQKDLGRNAANLDQVLVGSVFKMNRPETGKPQTSKVALANDAYALVELDAVKDGDPAKADAKTREAAHNQLAQGYGGLAARGYIDSLRKTAKIEIAEDRLQ